MRSPFAADCPRDRALADTSPRRPLPEPIRSFRRDKVVFISFFL